MVGNPGMTSVPRHSNSHTNKVAALSPYELHLRWSFGRQLGWRETAEMPGTNPLTLSVSAFPISHGRASFRSSDCRIGLKYASFFSVTLLEGKD